VLTGFLICGHLWDDRIGYWDQAIARWNGRAAVLIPNGTEHTRFSASRIFAAVYPEAVQIATLIASPTWRRLAAGSDEQQQRFVRETGAWLGRPDYRPPDHGDAIAHWMKFDSWRPPSRPQTTFPQTRDRGATRPAKTRPNSIEHHARSATWFAVNRRGGGVILHHRHVHPVLVRDWSPRMDGIEATLWASRCTTDFSPGHHAEHAASGVDMSSQPPKIAT